VSDAVAVDAKRILLRYGAPISVLDKVSEAERIAFARTVSRTVLAEREDVLRKLLTDLGYMEPAPPKGGKGSRSHKGNSGSTNKPADKKPTRAAKTAEKPIEKKPTRAVKTAEKRPARPVKATKARKPAAAKKAPTRKAKKSAAAKKAPTRKAKKSAAAKKAPTRKAKKSAAARKAPTRKTKKR